MATAYTSLLGLALPVTGELSGSWGDTVNTAITSLLDNAVAGTTSITADADITLTTTTGVANQARQAIILWNPASGTVTRNITAPAQSKIYTVINASGGTQSIVFRGAGPTTGVTIIKGESAVVAWNGTDFIKVSNTGGAGSFTNVTISGTTTLSGLTASTALALDASKNVVSVTNTGTGNNVLSASPTLTGTVTVADLTDSSLTATRVTYAGVGGNLVDSANMTFNGTRLTVADLADSGLTSGRVTYASTGGALVDSANLTFDGTTLTAAGLAGPFNGTVGATTASTGAFTTLTTSGAVTHNAGTANGVAYLNGSKVLTTGSALTFDGSNLGVGASPISGLKAYIASQSGNNTVRLDCGPGGFTSDLTFGAFGFAAVAGVRFEDANALLRLYANDARSIAFNAFNAEQMRLTSTGLGIGTSSPTQKLHVQGDTNANSAVLFKNVNAASTALTQLRLGNDANNLGGIQYTSSTFTGAPNAMQYLGDSHVFINTSGNERLRLNASGQLETGIAGSASAPSFTRTGDLNTGIFFPAADTIAFAEGGVESMRIDATGNLMVKTTTARANITTNANLVTENGLGILATSTTYGQSSQYIRFFNDGAAYAGSISQTAATGIGLYSAGDLILGSSSTERARITSGGDLLVGTTSTPNGGSVFYVAGGGTILTTQTTVSTACNHIVFRNSNGNVGNIQTSGTATAFNTSSDYRLKNITGPITTSGAYIDSLNPVEGTWKADGSTFVGLIAHEVQEASRTNVATGVKDGEEMQGMDYSSAELIANMLAELKSLRARVAALESI